MAIHNKSHNNHALMSLNKMRKEESLKNKTSSDFEMPAEIKLLHSISDCGDFLKQLPDKSIQLICIDPPYNLELAGGIFTKLYRWASKWIDEAYRVLSDNGSMVILAVYSLEM